MKRLNPTFSIVIIGFNTEQSLKKLLASIEKIIYTSEDVEVVYVDDGSTDNSLSVFEKYKLKFKTKSFAFNQNMGRVYASDKGIKLAEGEWILNLQSNVVVDDNILHAYCKAINNKVVAVGGKILYESDDQKFQAYLNHTTRGNNQYKQHEIIKYQHLLFGNCVIKQSIFHKINLNLTLRAYGGEELEFAYRLKARYPQQIIACKTATVTRVNHPELTTHCLRLEEFGRKNLLKLPFVLQKQVVRCPGFLYQSAILEMVAFILYKFSIKAYKIPGLGYIFIRLGMLMAIVLGYQRAR